MSKSRIIIELLRQNRLPTHRRPPTPGDIIRDEFLAHMDITQAQLAAALEMPVQRLNMILNGKRAVTPDTALRLSQCLGCSVQFWLGFQHDIELYDAITQADVQTLKKLPALTKELRAAKRIPDLERIPPERARKTRAKKAG
jgi:addiction module HigA family antidote